jgi:anti-sigma factor ChrR (cupin superfamily)
MATKARAGRPAATRSGVRAYDMAEAPWQDAGKSGIRQKIVHADHERGRYLGLIGFEAEAQTGLHQHLGTAISYFLQGSLTDYTGSASAGQAGINLKGATHDAVTYDGCLIAARLEAPVIYPEATPGPVPRIHAGGRRGAIVNPAPEVPPDINIPVAALPAAATVVPGVARRLVFDYRGTGDDRRFAQLAIRPGARVPRHRVAAPMEWFVIGGSVTVGGRTAGANSFVVIEPGTEIDYASDYGCLLLAWAEAPSPWVDSNETLDLYGF